MNAEEGILTLTAVGQLSGFGLDFKTKKKRKENLPPDSFRTKDEKLYLVNKYYYLIPYLKRATGNYSLKD
jgi:hypothetical protein